MSDPIRTGRLGGELEPEEGSELKSRLWSSAFQAPEPAEATASFGILQRHKRGDRDAGDELVERYSAGLMRYIRVLLGARLRGRVDSSDVFQDVFLTALPRLKDFEYRGKGCVFAYLKTVAKHRVQSLGSRAHVPADVEPTQDPFWLGLEQATEPPVGEELVSRELHAILDEALSRLPERARDLVAQRAYFGRSWDEIEASMEFQSRDAAYMAYQRAKLEWIEYAAPRLRAWMDA